MKRLLPGIMILAVSCGSQVRRVVRQMPIMKECVYEDTSSRHQMEWTMMNPPMPCIRHVHINIDNHRVSGSISVGTVINGFIVNPVELPLSGKAYRVMEQQAGRATNFGIRELVEMVKKTAQEVAKKYPGSIMNMANMAACGGGEIPWSVSHRSGRDVDIGFYMKNMQGRQVELSKMVVVEPDGTGETGDGRRIVFDTAKNWAMIRAIISDPGVSVQWIFIAGYLKRRLLDFAREHKEPRKLIVKASQVMWQPYGSSAHANHIHVRIYCPLDDILNGCRDIGSNRPWFVDHTDLIEKRVTKLAGILRVRKVGLAIKKQVLVTLGAMGTDSAKKAIAGMLGGQNISIRRTAARVLFRWGISQEVADALPGILNRERDGLTALYLLYALKRYRGRERCTLMCRVLGIHREWVVPAGLGTWRFRATGFAARVLALRGEVKAIPSLIRYLGTHNARDRQAILSALRRITARKLVFNAMDVEPKALHGVWADWYAMHKEENRMSLLVSGFAINGALSYESANGMSFNAKDLMGLYHRILTEQDPYNAAFLLSRLTRTGMWVPRSSMHSKFYYFNQRIMHRAADLGMSIPKSKCIDESTKRGGG